MTQASTFTEIRHTIGIAGELALRNVSGRVRLAGIDGAEVIVLVRAGRAREPELNVERSPGRLVVEPRRDGNRLFGLTFDTGGSYEFDVQVPRGARIDIKAVSADIDGSDLAGDQKYKTVSGDVRLNGASGKLSVMTVSGDVRLHDGGELEIDAATTSGDLTVEATLLRQLGVRTVSGDVRAQARLQPGARHSVETVSGDLNLVVAGGGVTVESSRALDLGRRRSDPIVVGDGSARLMFRSMSGDQRVTLGGRAGEASAPDIPSPPAPPEPPREPVSAEDRLEILRALERGELDIDEAARRLEGQPRA
ncbi:hypothetical protein BH23CHL7_BH23CHL7_12940 [soil metagenome]